MATRDEVIAAVNEHRVIVIARGFETITSSSIAKAIVLLIIIVFLQKKPQGLFTVRSRALD